MSGSAGSTAVAYRVRMNAALVTAPTSRFDTLDALRGAAMVWMTVFHFCFDLNHFGYLRQNFYQDPFWTWQRTAIVSLFLLCAGMGQAVAIAQQQSWPRFWRRWVQIAGCAVLVSAGSYWMYPNSFTDPPVMPILVTIKDHMRRRSRRSL